jgi:selenide,water dikinase
MCHLNRGAGAAISKVQPHACTDVTGFGLLGHLRNMLEASGVSATIEVAKVPVLKEARSYVARGIAPGGTHANWRFLNDWVTYAPEVSKEDQLILSDAQTSGGLLIAVAEEKLSTLLQELEANGTLTQSVVGRIESGEPGHMAVVG